MFGRVVAAVFLGLILVFVGWRVKLERDIDALVAVYRAAGLPTNGDELDAFYPSVPDDENAALGILKAGALVKNYSDERRGEVHRFRTPSRDVALSREEMELLQGYVDMNSNVLATAFQALTLPESRYPVDLSLGIQADISHLGSTRAVAKLFECQFLLAVESNEVAAAVESIQCLTALAGTLDNEPLIVSCLLRSSLVRRAVDLTQRLLNGQEVTSNSLHRLSEALAVESHTNVFARAMAGELAGMVEVLSLGQPELAFHDNDEGSDSSHIGCRLKATFTWLSGFFARDLRFYMRGMETNLALASLPAPVCLEMTNHFSEMERHAEARHHILVSMILPAMSKIVTKEVAGRACLAVGRSGVAVEQFRTLEGGLPDGLSDLVPEYLNRVPIDPFDGQPVRYRKLNQGYTVYSIGPDGRDDGGREPRSRIKSNDTNSDDITFIVER